jgi:hypothetical protein
MVAQFEKSGLSFEAYKDQYVCGPCNAGVKPKLPVDPDAVVVDEDLIPLPPKEYVPIIYSPRPPASMDIRGTTICWHQTIFLKNRHCDGCGVYDKCGYHAKNLTKDGEAQLAVWKTSHPAEQSPKEGEPIVV